MTRKITYIITTLLLSFGLFAQQYSISSDSEVKVEGTSNVHDWSAVVEDVRVSGGSSTSLVGLKVEFIVESMKSGDRLMDKRIHKTLNSEDHPKIVFNVTESERNGETLTMKGNLTINGVKKDITVVAKVTETSNGLTISGKQTILFTDYGMDAPSFMFGAMKVGNEVQIVYNVVLTR
ncbi:YceI family protein [Phaeocystidibacter luteus]|uniref:YceI family protein n=1 Tax=Phaeocystidibacter luteus TaxID=911197 RepID=A0A6N6RIT0_9FLAO|nr:YceI family protein [Phaeocystidibacter luteus]KAB2814253.1 YceI family protein [Phaeocystidibacter luteus]